jgi:acyl dehydratase
MTARGSNGRRLRLGAALALFAVLAAAPVLALAHGGSSARAVRPVFDKDTLRLVGSGGYATERRHREIRVTVCLRKRYGSRFFTVRCETDTDTDRRVRARVSVPGCVEGVWRTTALGEALGRDGEWSHAAFDASPRHRC